MKPITLPVAELKPALTGLSKVIAKRNALPVLNHLKIERTKDGWTTLTSTDLDRFITVRLEQPTEGEPLSLLVPYDELLKITKNCPKTDTLLLNGGDKAVTIQYAIGNQVADAKLASLPVDEFPEVPRIKCEPIPLPNSLRQAVLHALQCASIDETRAILNGAFVDVSKPNGHYVVGTDGRHLFSSNSFSLPLKESLIIPAHKFIEWKEFNNDGEWQLKVAPAEKKDESGYLQISSRRWRYISRQIEGNYPNWRQVVPTAFNTSLEFDPESVEPIIQTIQRTPVHDVINQTLGIEVKGKNASLLCKASADQKWMPVEVKDATTKGPDVTTLLNRNLLIKALQFGLLRLDLINAMSPLKFSEGGRQMIVMPVRPDSAPKSVPNPPSPTPAAAQPASPPPAEQPEKPSMPANTNGHTNGAPKAPATTTTDKSSLETALGQIENIKSDFRNAITGLNKLGEHLKQVQREQKTTEKEVQSVRSTIEKLQSLKL